MNKIKCRLCETASPRFFMDERTGSRFHHCPECDLRFLDPAQYLSADQEEERYRLHNNVVEDPGYQQFTLPVVELIKRYRKSLHILDFGCGNGPVIAHLLRADGHHISLYDPYFHPDRSVLEKKYDFIAMIEVAEHLYHPGREFKQLREILKDGGELAVMTALVTVETDFEGWYYRKDPTHVCFFSEKTAIWITEKFKFRQMRIHSPRLFSLIN